MLTREPCEACAHGICSIESDLVSCHVVEIITSGGVSLEWDGQESVEIVRLTCSAGHTRLVPAELVEEVVICP